MPAALSVVQRPEPNLRLPRVIVDADTYRDRRRNAFARTQAEWLVVYGDREHFGNIEYLSGFDPRFEEAILVVGPGQAAYLIVGNEGIDHASHVAPELETILSQDLSLMGQDRTGGHPLSVALEVCGIKRGETVGVVGWKYLDGPEAASFSGPAFVPTYLMESIRKVTGVDPVDATAMMISPQDGLRALSSAAQIAMHTRAAHLSSAAVFAGIDAAKPGRSEDDVARAAGSMIPEPQSMHLIVSAGTGIINGLRSSRGSALEYGQGVVHAVGLWGSLTCRAGLLSAHDNEFVSDVAAPYFGVIRQWMTTIRPGLSGAELWELTDVRMREAGFWSKLNPGHLTSTDEWLHSPIGPGSSHVLTSGMVLQCDIIPTPMRPGYVVNCEDTVAIADAALQAEFKRDHPEAWEAVANTRRFLADELGIVLHPDVLPLSPMTAYLPPLWLQPNLVFVSD